MEDIIWERRRILTHTEEIELAKRIELGRAAAEQLSAGDGVDHVALEAIVLDGKQARDDFILHNQALVVNIAKRWSGPMGVEIEEVVQIGNLGLMSAVDKFDWRKGRKFSTYATYWIAQSIQRWHSEKSRAVRLPTHLHEKLYKVRKSAEFLRDRDQLNREPTIEEIAEHAGYLASTIRRWLLAERRVLSLDKPIKAGDDDDLSLGNIIPSNSDVAETAEHSALSAEIAAVLGRVLTKRERLVVELRFGLTDGQPRKLEEVGQAIGLTRERARQIEASALKKLQSKAGVLAEWLD